MRTLLVFFSLLVIGASAGGIRCTTDAHCGAPAVHGKCVNGQCEFSPVATHNAQRRATKCSTGADCDDSSTCVDGKCVVNNGSGGACSSDAFCPNGYICVDSKCVVFKRRFNAEHCPESCKPPKCRC